MTVTEETRLALLEQSSCHIQETLRRIEDKFDRIDVRFNKVDDRLDRLSERVDANFKWTMGVMITLFSGLYATALGGMIARFCQWI